MFLKKHERGMLNFMSQLLQCCPTAKKISGDTSSYNFYKNKELLLTDCFRLGCIKNVTHNALLNYASMVPAPMSPSIEIQKNEQRKRHYNEEIHQMFNRLQ